MPRSRLSSADFKSFRPERRLHGALLTLSAAASPDSRTRVGFVVSKKVSPLATTRNLVKRRLRAALKGFAFPRPLSLVITAKPAARDAGYKEVEEDVASLLSQL